MENAAYVNFYHPWNAKMNKRKPISKVTMHDFSYPRFDNDPQNEEDAPCEKMDDVNSAMCDKCGADCPERVHEKLCRGDTTNYEPNVWLCDDCGYPDCKDRVVDDE